MSDPEQKACPKSKLEHVSLRTINCIITGEPATTWTGHVMAEAFGGFTGERGQFLVRPLSIIAGFKDGATCDKATREIPGACFGAWKPADGVEDNFPPNDISPPASLPS